MTGINAMLIVLFFAGGAIGFIVGTIMHRDTGYQIHKRVSRLERLLRGRDDRPVDLKDRSK